MMPNKALSAVDQAFPAKVKDLMPPMSEIPAEFKRDSNKWVGVFNDFFFKGAKNIDWKPKEGIDKAAAIRHVRTVMGSYEPKHEHKEAACAYLMSQWFDDITYDVGETKSGAA